MTPEIIEAEFRVIDGGDYDPPASVRVDVFVYRWCALMVLILAAAYRVATH